MITAGVDAGSRMIKVALWDTEEQMLVGSAWCDQGVHQVQLAGKLLDDLLRRLGLTRNDCARTVATGYGRNIIDFSDSAVTEITCHAVGVQHLAPRARTIVEIGGQDSKVIWLDDSGVVQDFAMNDRCAAGTGRFLELAADKVSIGLHELEAAARKSAKPAVISSMCVVFAETEIIGLLASGVCPEDIVAGVQSSIASRVFSMAGGRVRDEVVFTGGVALVSGMTQAISQAFGHPVQLCEDPRMSGALGAALIAARQASL